MSGVVSFADIEDAIMARLTAARDQAVLGYDATIETYGGTLTLDQDRLRELARRAPAFLVMFAGERTMRPVGQQVQVEGSFVVLAAARRLRNDGGARRGGSGSIGAYQLYLDVQALLLRQRLGLDIGPISFARGQNLATAASHDLQLALYAITLQTQYLTPTPSTPDAPLDDFTSTHLLWDFAGTAVVDDANDNPDAVADTSS